MHAGPMAHNKCTQAQVHAHTGMHTHAYTYKHNYSIRKRSPSPSQSVTQHTLIRYYPAHTTRRGHAVAQALETAHTSPNLTTQHDGVAPTRTGSCNFLFASSAGCLFVSLILSPLLLQLGPLRNVEGVAEIAGCMAGAGVVLVLALALSVYGSAQFQSPLPLGVKTLSGRSVARDPLQSADG